MSGRAIATRKRSQLTRADWCNAALSALAESGVEAVAIEPLAKALNVTKGSGYWHFRSRGELLEATLDAWETRTTARTIERLLEIADPRERLAELFRQAMAKDLDSRVFLSLVARDREPIIAKALQRVSQRRMAFLEKCYAEFLDEPSQAHERATIAYAAYLGVMLVRRHGPASTHSSQASLVQRMISTLVYDGAL